MDLLRTKIMAARHRRDHCTRRKTLGDNAGLGLARPPTVAIGAGYHLKTARRLSVWVVACVDHSVHPISKPLGSVPPQIKSHNRSAAHRLRRGRAASVYSVWR